jgi:hypothetical protein
MKINLAGMCVVLLCASCATEKWGVYDVVYSRQIDKEFSARVLATDDDILLRILHRGDVVGELSYYSNQTKSVLSPFPRDYDDLTSITSFCEGTNIITVRWLMQGTNSVILLDRDNDGIPEKRSTHKGDDVLMESITPTYQIWKKDKEAEQEN